MKKSEKKILFDKYLEKAFELQVKGMFKEAIFEYKEASKIMPEDFLPIHNIGIVYYQLGDIKNCEKYLKKSYEMDPKNELTALNIGDLYYKQKKYTLAIRYFKKGIYSHHAKGYIFKSFCDALYKTGKYREAVKYLKIALDVCDLDTDFHLMLIDTLIQLENFKDAISVLDMIKLSDKNASKMQKQKELVSIGQKYLKNIKIKNKKQVSSLCEFIEEINKIKENNEGIYIYRGQNNKYLPLIPSLYRKKSYIEDENNIIQDFNLKAEAFFNHEIETFDGVDKIVLMQHYGVPTRLLDFTESPLVALYFALEKISSESYDSAPCVYVINTKSFSHNREGLLFTSKQIASESKDAKRIFKYSKGTCAFSPKLKNKRLIAQKGVFVLFNEKTPLEKSIGEENLIKFEIPREYIDKIKQELNNIGITPSTIYPDFTGLSEEIKTPHKFMEEVTTSKLEIEKPSTQSYLTNNRRILDLYKMLE